MSTLPDTLVSPYEIVGGAVDRSQVAVVVPTFNAAGSWEAFHGGLRQQGLAGDQILIVDSSSDDGTRELATKAGYRVFQIERRDFNHGGTRKLALGMVPWASIVVYLTQDAVLATSDSLDRLLSAFKDEQVAAAYGRQLPRPGAGPIEAHARLFNYPAQSDVRDIESRHNIGIKAAFLSNSFSAYRVKQLAAVGGFPSDVIMAEDTVVAGKLLLAGWKTAYVADAEVYHSHAFTIAEEFQRYFDTGVYHDQQGWLTETFGRPEGEGKRFVMSELAYLTPRHLYLIPYAVCRTISKAIGYTLGLHRSALGIRWSRWLSYHKTYWDSVSSSQ
jgi:rhamnosyltransferase